jgi:hypothetical protein
MDVADDRLQIDSDVLALILLDRFADASHPLARVDAI